MIQGLEREAEARADDHARYEHRLWRGPAALAMHLAVQGMNWTRLAQATTLDVDGGPSEFALDRMISPQAFRLVHAGTGQALTSAPTPLQVAPLMRTLDARHACLLDAAASRNCLLTFAKDKARWRLVGMRALGLRIELADART